VKGWILVLLLGGCGGGLQAVEAEAWGVKVKVTFYPESDPDPEAVAAKRRLEECLMDHRGTNFFVRGQNQPGTWRPARVEGVWTVRIWCPRCGLSATLEEHQIAPDGYVYPSLVCPHRCGFHEFGRLCDWSTDE
jgi:ribosomal protein S27AE